MSILNLMSLRDGLNRCLVEVLKRCVCSKDCGDSIRQVSDQNSGRS